MTIHLKIVLIDIMSNISKFRVKPYKQMMEKKLECSLPYRKILKNAFTINFCCLEFRKSFQAIHKTFSL